MEGGERAKASTMLPDRSSRRRRRTRTRRRPEERWKPRGRQSRRVWSRRCPRYVESMRNVFCLFIPEITRLPGKFLNLLARKRERPSTQQLQSLFFFSEGGPTQRVGSRCPAVGGVVFVSAWRRERGVAEPRWNNVKQHGFQPHVGIWLPTWCLTSIGGTAARIIGTNARKRTQIGALGLRLTLHA